MASAHKTSYPEDGPREAGRLIPDLWEPVQQRIVDYQLFHFGFWGAALYQPGVKRHIRPMAILKIARMGHPVLLAKAELISDPKASEIQQLIEDMVETMVDANGAGLAAPQVHVPLRLVVFQAPAERADEGIGEEEKYDHTAPLTILINPEITPVSDDIVEGWEGCLSVPGLRGLVPRHSHIHYRGTTPDGEKFEREARGFHARVVQHECDHLDGILYPHRMRDLSSLIFESEIRHLVEDVET